LKLNKRWLSISVFTTVLLLCVTQAFQVAAALPAKATEHESLGAIDQNMFAQLPPILVIGQTYSLQTRITNTGSAQTSYLLAYEFPFQQSISFIASFDWREESFTLAPGNATTFKFQIQPVRPLNKPMTITARLFAKDPVNGTSLLIDMAQTTVQQIIFSQERPLLLSSSVVLILSFIVGTIAFYARNRRHRIELIICGTLFAVALLLRSYNFMHVAVYADEMIMSKAALVTMQNSWIWPQSVMLDPPYPPVLEYLIALTVYFFGYGLDVARWISILAGSLTVVPLYLLGKELYNRKTGITAALAFAFFGMAIIYSDVIRSESLTLFFIVSAAYMFWHAQSRHLLRWFVASGIMMGLAVDTKYIAGVQFVGIIIYYVWSERSLKAILNKQLLVWFAAFLFTVAPIQMDLMVYAPVNPIYYYYYNYVKVGTSGAGGIAIGNYAPPKPKDAFDLIFRAYRSYIYETTRSASPWFIANPVLVITACVVVTGVPILYLWRGYRGSHPDQFLTVLFGIMTPILAISITHSYWFLYLMPFLFIMASSLTVGLVSRLKVSNTWPNVRQNDLRFVKMALLATLMIFLLLNGIVGAATPFIDNDEYEASRIAALYLENHAPPGALVALDPTVTYQFTYYVTQYQLNISIVMIRVPSSALGAQPLPTGPTSVIDPWGLQSKWIVPAEVITLGPEYLILSRALMLTGLNQTMRNIIFGQYTIVSYATPSTGYDWGHYYWGSDLTTPFTLLILQKLT